jgi:uncharacterized protein (DUF1778 family)
MKTYKEMVREAEQVKDTEGELEGLVPVKALVTKNVRHVFSLRIGAQELTEISQAAKERGISISDFMRQASLAAVHGELDLKAGKQATILQEVRKKTRELAEALNKL